mgnify:FL=1
MAGTFFLFAAYVISALWTFKERGKSLKYGFIMLTAQLMIKIHFIALIFLYTLRRITDLGITEEGLYYTSTCMPRIAEPSMGAFFVIVPYVGFLVWLGFFGNCCQVCRRGLYAGQLGASITFHVIYGILVIVVIVGTVNAVVAREAVQEWKADPMEFIPSGGIIAAVSLLYDIILFFASPQDGEKAPAETEHVATPTSVPVVTTSVVVTSAQQ